MLWTVCLGVNLKGFEWCRGLLLVEIDCHQRTWPCAISGDAATRPLGGPGEAHACKRCWVLGWPTLRHSTDPPPHGKKNQKERVRYFCWRKVNETSEIFFPPPISAARFLHFDSYRRIFSQPTLLCTQPGLWTQVWGRFTPGSRPKKLWVRKTPFLNSWTQAVDPESDPRAKLRSTKWVLSLLAVQNFPSKSMILRGP